MKKHSFQSSYYVIPIKTHSEIKNRFLDLIDESDSKKLKTSQEQISKSDWEPKNDDRKYIPFFYEIIKPYMNAVMNDMHAKSWYIYKAWFQQYLKNDYHGWHNHAGSQWAGVYFLELPDTKLQTKLFDQTNKKFIENIEITEGSVLLFPSYLTHKSMPNKTGKRKTIISFNCCFWEYDDKQFEEFIKNV